MTLSEWQKLLCKCGSEKFVKIMSLNYHESQGTSERQEGWQCLECGERVRTDKMIKELQRKKKKAELQALQEEIGPEPEPEKTTPSIS